MHSPPEELVQMRFHVCGLFCIPSLNPEGLCRAPLQFEDIWELPPDDRVGHLAGRFRPIWQEQLKRRDGPSLVCHFESWILSNLYLTLIRAMLSANYPLDNSSHNILLTLSGGSPKIAMPLFGWNTLSLLLYTSYNTLCLSSLCLAACQMCFANDACMTDLQQ